MAVSEHHFPCPACGADLRYNPGQDQLVCDNCGHSEEIDAGGPWSAGSALRELDFNQAVSGELAASETEETRVLSCPNCGAQTEYDPDTHAAECPFCATPVVTDTGTHRHIKPRAVLPFFLDEKAAKAAMNAWLGQLWFAPNGLQEYARKGRRMQGIYVPFWTYDAKTRSDYRGQRGIVHQKRRRVSQMVNGKRQSVTRTETEVRWTRVRGTVARDFDDILVLASTSLPKDYTDALAPWDLVGLVPYQPEYLAGFRAEAYQVELADGFGEARGRMDAMIRRDIRFDIGGDRQRIDDVNTKVWDVTFKHILLPVWVAAYKYQGKSYRFVVNARTGAVKGERPWSAWKIALAVVLVALLAGAAGYFIAQNQ